MEVNIKTSEIHYKKERVINFLTFISLHRVIQKGVTMNNLLKQIEQKLTELENKIKEEQNSIK